jgi:ribokinase
MRDASEVLVIGDAVLDVAVAPEDEPRPGGDVPAAVGAAPGGQGANIAVRLARRGVPVRLACALGEDVAGRIVRHALSAEGVLLEAAGAGGSGVVVILVAADGERTMFSRRIPLLPLAFDTTAAWTIVSGYVLLEDGELQLNDRGGRTAVVGCSLPEGAASDWWLRVESMRPDLVVMNAEEARAVGGDAARLALEAAALVVVTRPDGVEAAYPNPELAVRRVGIDRVAAADTTGAGDAFAAALIAELREPSWPPSPPVLDRALAVAAAFAAEVTRVAGAQTRVPGESSG